MAAEQGSFSSDLLPYLQAADRRLETSRQIPPVLAMPLQRVEDTSAFYSPEDIAIRRQINTAVSDDIQEHVASTRNGHNSSKESAVDIPTLEEARETELFLTDNPLTPQDRPGPSITIVTFGETIANVSDGKLPDGRKVR